MEVEVLYQYESSTASGKSVNVHPGEHYKLLDDKDPWLFVTKTFPTEGFYLPKNYVQFPASPIPSAASQRHSTCLPGSISRAANPALAAVKGFKIGDPKLAAKSIPTGLDTVHNINDLAAQQDIRERRRENGAEDEGPAKPATARPISALLPPNHPRLSQAPPPPPPAPSNGATSEPTYEHIAPVPNNNNADAAKRSEEPTEREYENLDEYWNSEKPPQPRPGQSPLREMEEGWGEFEDEAGRRFYHHAQSRASTWKPPRMMKSPAEVAQLLASSTTVDEEGKKGLEESGYNSLIATIASPDPPPPPPSLPSSLPNSFPPPPSHSDLDHSMELAGLHSASSPKALKCGQMDFCRQVQQGRKNKKVWASAYVFLTSAHLILYKDEAASKKKGSHYSAPLGVCDLRGARLERRRKEESRRKNTFLLHLLNGDVWAWAAGDEADATSWFAEIHSVIAVLPHPEPYPPPPPDGGSTSLSRRASGGWRATSLRVLPGTASPPASPTKTKESRRSATPMTASVVVDESPITESRESILERLRKLFRSRPSIDTLREKGIYKPEPVFGSSLVEICKREDSTVPKFVRVCTETIERKGLDMDGLYRISGNLSQIQRIRCQVDQDVYGLLEAEEDVHVLTGALKLFFRELQEPLFPQALSKELLNANKASPRARLESFRQLLRKELQPPHYDTLKLLLKHLLRVAENSARNRMQIHNLAIVFGPTLFSAGQKPGGPVKGKAKGKEKKAWKSSQAPPAPEDPAAFSSNSHLAFNMIMQGQILEFLLKEYSKLWSSEKAAS